jgi:hypothetical protein
MNKNATLIGLFDFAVGMSIAFFLYLLDRYNDLSVTLSGVIGFFALFFILMLLVAVFIQLLSRKLFKSTSFSFLDAYMLILEISFLSLHILYNPSFQFVDTSGKDYDVLHVFYTSALAIVSIFFVFRFLAYFFAWKSKKKQQGNEVTNVGDFLNVPVSKEKAEKAIFLDSPADKDLFHRGHIEDSVRRIICDYSGPRPMVIGIKGDWGVGKTTLADFVCKKLDKNKYLVVETISAWGYNDEESLVRAILARIMAQIDFGISPSAVKKLINDFLSTTFSTIKAPLLQPIGVLFANEEKENDSVVDLINSYLTKNSVVLVLRIEDFDRMAKDQILFVYQCVSSFLHLKNVVYLLCFSEKPVKNAFKSAEIDYQYLNKIINFSFELLMPSKEELGSMYSKWLGNFLTYSVRNTHSEELDKIAKEWATLLPTMREFLLILNQIRQFAFLKEKVLDLYDEMRLQGLLISDFSAYDFVRLNPGLFCPVVNRGDLPRDDSPYMGNEAKTIAKKTLDGFLQKEGCEKFRETFYELCPYLQEGDGSNYSAIEQNKGRPTSGPRLMNSRYFDLFFLDCDNSYSVIYSLLLPVFNVGFDKSKLPNQFSKYYDEYKESFLAVLWGMIDPNKSSPILVDIFRWCLSFSGSSFAIDSWDDYKKKAKMESIAFDCFWVCSDPNSYLPMIHAAIENYFYHPSLLFDMTRFSENPDEHEKQKGGKALELAKDFASKQDLIERLDEGRYSRGAIWQLRQWLPEEKQSSFDSAVTKNNAWRVLFEIAFLDNFMVPAGYSLPKSIPQFLGVFPFSKEDATNVWQRYLSEMFQRKGTLGDEKGSLAGPIDPANI